MRIVVVGGSGLIGDKVMTALYDAGHQAVAASPAFGIDAFTGEGLDEAMAAADLVVDVSNAPAWEDENVLKFFTTVTRNALEAVAARARGTMWRSRSSGATGCPRAAGPSGSHRDPATRRLVVQARRASGSGLRGHAARRHGTRRRACAHANSGASVVRTYRRSAPPNGCRTLSRTARTLGY
jgi:hypothetical protein